MASLIIGAGALAYGSIKNHREKKKARREHNDARFAELERENATRLERLERPSCSCHEKDGSAQDCEIHGHNSYTNPAGHGVGEDEGIDADQAPAYQEQGVESQVASPEVSGEGRKEEDVERINEERRVGMKGNGFGNWRLRRKRKDADNEKEGDMIVR